MPVYIHNNQRGEPVEIKEFVKAGGRAGPLPYLTATGHHFSLPECQGVWMPNNSSAQITYTWLYTCAAVIFTSSEFGANEGAWIYHANSGGIDAGVIDQAMRALGYPSKKTVFVVYAHPGTVTDAGYQDTISFIQRQGILDRNFLEIPNLAVGQQFGVNHQGMIGVLLN